MAFFFCKSAFSFIRKNFFNKKLALLYTCHVKNMYITQALLFLVLLKITFSGIFNVSFLLYSSKNIFQNHLINFAISLTFLFNVEKVFKKVDQRAKR